jgi:hypothetical protein
MPIVQGQSYPHAMFFLTNATTAPAGLPGQTFSGSEIVVVKPNAATAPAANIATVVDKGGGWYVLTLSTGETSLGLAEGQTGELGIEINKSGALPNRAIGYEVVATAPGALTTAERAAIVAALASNFAPLATAAGVTAATAPLATAAELDALAAVVAALPAAPSAATVAAAVGALEDADGVSLLEHQAMAGAMLYGNGTFPDDGAFEARALGTSTVRVAGTVAPTTGVRTVTTRVGD